MDFPNFHSRVHTSGWITLSKSASFLCRLLAVWVSVSPRSWSALSFSKIVFQVCIIAIVPCFKCDLVMLSGERDSLKIKFPVLTYSLQWLAPILYSYASQNGIHCCLVFRHYLDYITPALDHYQDIYLLYILLLATNIVSSEMFCPQCQKEEINGKENWIAVF